MAAVYMFFSEKNHLKHKIQKDLGTVKLGLLPDSELLIFILK